MCRWSVVLRNRGILKAFLHSSPLLLCPQLYVWFIMDQCDNSDVEISPYQSAIKHVCLKISPKPAGISRSYQLMVLKLDC